MESFLIVITSFPTIVFTFLFVFCIFYWLVAVLGVIEFDFLDFDIPDAASDTADSLSNVSAFAGLLIRLGLQGVPFPLTMSLITVFGWVICYYLSLFLLPLMPSGLMKYLAGVPVFIFSFFSAVFVTKKILQPLRPMFRSADQEVKVSIIGKVAIIRSSRVDRDFGEANVNHEGADLIVKVRAFGESAFKKGDKVVLVELTQENNTYKVVSEQEFKHSFS